MTDKMTIFTPQKKLLVEANPSDFTNNLVVFVEGNYYFDLSLVDSSQLELHGAGKNYYCPIKLGHADYYDLVDSEGNILLENVGWVYPKVDNTLFEKIVGKIAFDTTKGLNIEK